MAVIKQQIASSLVAESKLQLTKTKKRYNKGHVAQLAVALSDSVFPNAGMPDSRSHETSCDIYTSHGATEIKYGTASVFYGFNLTALATYILHTIVTTYAYVTPDYQFVYYMDRNTFARFIILFGRRDRDSRKRGGNIKTRLKQNKKMIAWLEAQLSTSQKLGKNYR